MKFTQAIKMAMKSILSNKLRSFLTMLGLKRLEKEHYIQSYWGDESLGARRKYYHITSDGIEYLHRAILQWQSAQKIISKVLMGGTENG